MWETISSLLHKMGTNIAKERFHQCLLVPNEQSSQQQKVSNSRNHVLCQSVQVFLKSEAPFLDGPRSLFIGLGVINSGAKSSFRVV